MIPRLPGWTWETRADSILLTAPEGGAIRYFESLRPLERLGDLLRRHAPAGYADVQLRGEPERLLTREGEHAALVQLDATLDGQPVRRALGFVFLDDAYAYVGGLAPRDRGEPLAQAVRELVLGDAHQLGLRRRRFVYRPPRDWQGLMLGGAVTHYFPPQHPRASARLTVYPAIPFAANVTPTVDLQRLMGEDLIVTQPGPPSGFALIAQEPSAPVSAPAGLDGTRWRLRGRWNAEPIVEREIVLLRDDRHAYAVELLSDADTFADGHTRLEDIVRSIEPIPRPGPAHEHAGDVFSYLAE